jgi:hypothetical protein
MKRFLMIMIMLMTFQASATVEDSGVASSDVSGNTWANPSSPSLPSYLPSPCPNPTGSLSVTISLTGPEGEPDKSYTTQGKPIDFIVSVKNDGSTDVEASVSVKPKGCSIDWFSWTGTTMQIPAGVSRSQALQVQPDINAIAGSYSFGVEASAKCRRSGSKDATFNVQALDYASETAVSGTGQFQINKDIRSMNSGIKSTKNVLFSGSVDALVKNEYLIEQAKGKNANFLEKDAVDNYNAVAAGDGLMGTESFKSSAIFGGVGANVKESYDVQQMEFKNQDFTLHQTGSLKKMAEFKTADNFTGYYLIDAKQIIPGQKNLKEQEEYIGSFEINRRILFRDGTTTRTPCMGMDCLSQPEVGIKSPSSPTFSSPCLSSSCNDFTSKLNALTSST